MRHRVQSKQFNRDTNNRKALLMNLVRSLVEHGQITTTKAKAKEIKRIADKLVHKAQDDSLNTRRVLHRFFGKRDVVNTLVDRIAPLFTDRTSGFTRIQPLGKRRGDNTEVVTLSFVKTPTVVKTLKNPTPKTGKAAPASKEKSAVKSTKVEAKSVPAKKAAPASAKKTATKTVKKAKPSKAE